MADTILLDPVEIEGVTPATDTYILDQDEAYKTQNITLQDRILRDVSFNLTIDDKGEAGISFRGLNYKSTDYIQDGIPLYRSVNGFVDTKFIMESATLSVNDGSKTSSLGVSAIGGEIEIHADTPKQALESLLSTRFSNNDEYYHARVGGLIDDIYLQLDSSLYHRSDYQLSEHYEPTPLQDKGPRINSDKQQEHVSLKSGIFLDDRTHLAAKVSMDHATYGMPPNVFSDPANPVWDAYTRIDKKELHSLYLYGDYDTNILSLTMRAYYDAYEDIWTIYDDPSYQSHWPKMLYDDQRLGSIIKANLTEESSSNTFIILWEKNTHHRKEGGLENAIFETSTFKGSYLYSDTFKEHWKLDSGISYTYIQSEKEPINNLSSTRSKEALDAQLKIGYQYKDLNLYAGIAHKNRMPAMYEMFAFFPWEVTNPGLKPEKSLQYTSGYKQIFQKDTSLDTAIYFYDIRDLIVYRDMGYINREKASHYGLDIRLENHSISNHRVSLSYAYAQAKDSEGEPLEFIPNHSIKLEDTITIDASWEAFIAYQYNSSRHSSNSATYTDEQMKLDAYHLAEIQLRYQVDEHTDIRAGIKNILDEDYEWRYGYPSEGRSYYLSLTWELN